MKLVAFPARISTASSTFEAEFQARLHWSADTDAAIEQRVRVLIPVIEELGQPIRLRLLDRLAATKLAYKSATDAALRLETYASPEEWLDRIEQLVA